MRPSQAQRSARRLGGSVPPVIFRHFQEGQTAVHHRYIDLRELDETARWVPYSDLIVLNHSSVTLQFVINGHQFGGSQEYEAPASGGLNSISGERIHSVAVRVDPGGVAHDISYRITLRRDSSLQEIRTVG